MNVECIGGAVDGALIPLPDKMQRGQLVQIKAGIDEHGFWRAFEEPQVSMELYRLEQDEQPTLSPFVRMVLIPAPEEKKEIWGK